MRVSFLSQSSIIDNSDNFLHDTLYRSFPFQRIFSLSLFCLFSFSLFQFILCSYSLWSSLTTICQMHQYTWVNISHSNLLREGRGGWQSSPLRTLKIFDLAYQRSFVRVSEWLSEFVFLERYIIEVHLQTLTMCVFFRYILRSFPWNEAKLLMYRCVMEFVRYINNVKSKTKYYEYCAVIEAMHTHTHSHIHFENVTTSLTNESIIEIVCNIIECLVLMIVVSITINVLQSTKWTNMDAIADEAVDAAASSISTIHQQYCYISTVHFAPCQCK